MCSRIQELTSFVFNVAFVPMRVEIDKVNKVFENDMQNLAIQGENYQYIILSICVGLVVLSEAVIIPFFSWTIKEKSRVIAIFSDIEIDEVKQVIESQKLDTRKIVFKRSWINDSGGHQNIFWDKVIEAHHLPSNLPKEKEPSSKITAYKKEKSPKKNELVEEEEKNNEQDLEITKHIQEDAKKRKGKFKCY